jgi:nucleoside-diphosphate-sugar epimerase
MKVFVSGGTGLVGRYIVEDLLAAGYSVIVGGRNRPDSGFFSKPVTFLPMTLDPREDQSYLFDDAYFFVHAAFSHIPGKYRGGEGDDPAEFRRLNLDGTIKLFETAQRAGIRRCVFISSRAVYGDRLAGEVLCESTKPTPNTLYGQVKLDAERALLTLAAPGFAPVILRATGIYGDLSPNKWDDLFADYLGGRSVSARAGTEVHGRDLARAVRMMLETETGRIDREIFNVSDMLTETHEILKLLQQETDCPNALPAPAPEGIVSEMDTAKIRALGWTTGGEELLRATIRMLASKLPATLKPLNASASSRSI